MFLVSGHIPKWAHTWWICSRSKMPSSRDSQMHDEHGQRQMAALAARRATTHHFMDASERQGSFHLSLTDLHSKAHVRRRAMELTSHRRSRVNKRTACVEAGPPYWLTSQPIDGLQDLKNHQQYEMVLEKYLTTYADEELRRNGLTREADLQRKTWHSGRYRFFEIVFVPKDMYNLFDGHIRPCSTSASRKCPSLMSSPFSTEACKRRAQTGSGKSGRHTSLS